MTICGLTNPCECHVRQQLRTKYVQVARGQMTEYLDIQVHTGTSGHSVVHLRPALREILRPPVPQVFPSNLGSHSLTTSYPGVLPTAGVVYCVSNKLLRVNTSRSRPWDLQVIGVSLVGCFLKRLV